MDEPGKVANPSRDRLNKEKMNQVPNTWFYEPAGIV